MLPKERLDRLVRSYRVVLAGQQDHIVGLKPFAHDLVDALDRRFDVAEATPVAAMPGQKVHMRELIEGGEFRAVVDRRYPMDQVAEAHRYVETWQKTGNVVLTIP